MVRCCLYVRTHVRTVAFVIVTAFAVVLYPFDVPFMGLSDSFIFAKKGPEWMHFYRICFSAVSIAIFTSTRDLVTVYRV